MGTVTRYNEADKLQNFIFINYIMEYTWTIIKIGKIETVGKNAIEKRTVVLEEVNQSLGNWTPWWLAFDLIKDKTKLIDWYKVWDVVTVSLNFKTNYYEVKDTYYNSITAWKVSKDSSGIEDSTGDLPF